MDELPDEQVQGQLSQAAEIVTRHLDAALEECTEAGLGREVFSAAVMATLMQAMQTSLGTAASDALRDMLQMMAAGGDRQN
ncbi:hypothetical protein [Minwuia thermotolerans]|jgi:hypothetical protein|uniref:Uncharacterized protein n=1 Tax=Minwuia thermotolerans TaxID=2056226 RepID=A0A2M9G6B2_9PROT|nr:hypothetical protein [Minwuia thermotolerans]ANK82380.1 MAG: hypothetical protein TEF_17450 [Rhizobiales bacterium NRL2]PJK31244.1 hypothetical protein CVT23_03170 [Minwuia thermotolerans]